MARMVISGTVVERRKNDWAINGKSGTSYQLYVREEGASQADSAQLVVVAPEQFGSFAEGDVVSLPVNVFANLGERQGVPVAKLSVKLDPEFDPAQSRHSAEPAF